MPDLRTNVALGDPAHYTLHNEERLQINMLRSARLNVKDPAFGAKGDGGTDDTASIAAALAACPEGGEVFLPVGVYRTSSPLVVPKNVTLRGTHAPRWMSASGTGTPSCIKALSGFTGSAVLRLLDKEEAGASVEQGGQRVYSLGLDGNLVAAVHGVYATGRVRDVVLENVHATSFGGDGFKTGPFTRADTSQPRPMAWKLANCVANACGGDGFDTDLLFDSTYIDCVAIGNSGHGFNLSAPGACSFIGCRAEFNGVKGFSVVGWFNGDLVFSACRTDRNQQDGFWFGGLANGLGGTGGAAVVLTGCQSGRDGKNGSPGAGGGNWAGFAAHECVIPVVFNACSVHPGVEDDGSGTQSPQYALRVRHLTGTVPKVHVNGGVWWGATGTLFNDSSGAAMARVRVDSTAEAMTGAATGTPTVDNTFGGVFAGSPEWRPADHGMLAWSYDPVICSTSSVAVSGTLYLARVHLPVRSQVTNVLVGINAAGSGLTSGQSIAGLWKADGTLIAVTADQSASWTSTGAKSMALIGGPYTLDAGDYYVGYWSVGTTPPAFSRATNTFMPNVNLAAPNFRQATANTGLTTTAPNPFGAQTTSGAVGWAGVS